MTDLKVGSPINSCDAWNDLTEWLPTMLEQLLDSEKFNKENRPPRDQRGIYLFSEDNEHLYVGRTGITARSRAKGGEPSTSFRDRFDQHIQPGRPPGSSSFANRLMLRHAAESGLAVPGCWWEDRKTTAQAVYGLYLEKKNRIGAMKCRVLPFDDDVMGIRSTVAEMYVHAVLGTPYNDFSTS